MKVKRFLSTEGIQTQKFQPSMEWAEFKLNAEGLVPVIVQDYQTCEVLMLAYMNEEAYHTTLTLGCRFPSKFRPAPPQTKHWYKILLLADACARQSYCKYSQKFSKDFWKCILSSQAPGKSKWDCPCGMQRPPESLVHGKIFGRKRKGTQELCRAGPGSFS